MRKSYDVFFASSNRHKYAEVKDILAKFQIRVGFFKFNPVEIQSDSISDIARKKALDAYKKCKRPVIVEDVGLFIKSLNGFPGPYSSFVYQTVGNRGILRLVGKKRDAEFLSVVAFCDGKRLNLFEGSVRGRIAKKPEAGGWGYDPIFIPRGKIRTYAQIDDKNAVSHRYVALAKFATYMLQSSGR
jgi:XTP/dITP diphosphohydrolase